MEKATWKIEMADGTVIEGLERRDSCFISDTELSVSDGGLSEVIASADGEPDVVWNNAELVRCASIDGRFWFTFRELSADELWKLKIEAQTQYLAMMTDTDLEEV